ncbi:MAG: MarR family transcriptional regulator [Clostridiales bacterium]|nr:MarR family transcriptional regulator [Clostridiales bacterium]
MEKTMELTTNRLLYLLYLNQNDKKNCTVTQMAKVFQVSKSTVSRNMDYLVEQGVVYTDTMQLTAYGQKLAAQYEEEVSLFEGWIIGNSLCDEKESRENAIEMVVNLSEGMKKQMFQKLSMNNVFNKLNHRGNVYFSEFVANLKAGSYPASFAIYREEYQKGKYISMADKGFEHPALLKVYGNTGMIQLKAVTMERRNIMDNLIMSGKLLKMDYYVKGHFEPVDKEGDFYRIPAEALEYTFHKDENLIFGNIMIQIYAPLANKKIHKKRALLSLTIQTV